MNMITIVTTAVTALAMGLSAASYLGEEHFGNSPLPADNFTAWPQIIHVVNDTSRVYHSWVNGNEHCYYQGDVETINKMLAKFADVEVANLEVILRPAPGQTKSFQGEPVRFNAMLHLVGGIALHQTTLDKGSLIWSDHPQLHIYIGETINLDQLKLPAKLAVIGIGELKRRNLEALSSTDQSVRGWGCGNLAALDPYDVQSATAITKLLADREDWVRLNAAGALGSMQATAKHELAVLQKTEATKEGPLSEQLKTRVQESVSLIRDAQPDTKTTREHAEVQRAIEEFLSQRSKAGAHSGQSPLRR
jgi:hypothetical protein